MIVSAPHWAGQGRCALLTTVPERPPDNAAVALRSLFGLSGAEAELAQAVAEGRELAQIAIRRGVKLTTTRTQLASAKMKMGAKRLADIGAIVTRMELLVPMDAAIDQVGGSGS